VAGKTDKLGLGRSDPYWTPFDYSTAWGPDACGGD